MHARTRGIFSTLEDPSVTQPEARSEQADVAAKRVGVVLVFANGKPVQDSAAITVSSLTIGRKAQLTASDTLLSREHAEAIRVGQAWMVRDLGSKNGTVVNGVRIGGDKSTGPSVALRTAPPGVIRMGQTLCLLVDDVRSFAAPIERRPNMIVGPILRHAIRDIEQLSTHTDAMLLLGASGTGKELAAQCFHASGPKSTGPLVAVNCATIPPGVAERVLFGARKGAFSGATADSDGYIQAADGGTLFLDELAELELAVQAKLLRVLQTKQVTRLGDTAARTVDIRVCAATNARVREAIAQGKFREDLYYRLSKPEVKLPPLCERLVELPVHICDAVTEVNPKLTIDVRFIEACFLRQWPGNVRELRSQVALAAQRALLAGGTTVDVGHLTSSAGTAIHQRPSDNEEANEPPAPPSREELAALLERTNGNVSQVARDLAIHRNQLVRWLERTGLKTSD